MEPLNQPITLEFIAPKGAPLDGLILQLKRVQDYLNAIAGGPKIDDKFRQSVAEIESSLKQTFKRGAISATAMATSLGLDKTQTAAILGRMREIRRAGEEISGLNKQATSFSASRSGTAVENAAKAFRRAFDAEIAHVEKNYGKLLTPTIAQVSEPVKLTADSAAVTAEIERIQKRLAELKVPPVPVKADATAAAAEIAKIEKRLAELRSPAVAAQAEIAKLEAQLAKLKTVTAPGNLGPRLEALAAQKAAGEKLTVQSNTLLKRMRESPEPRVRADHTAFETRVAELKAARIEISKIEQQLAGLKAAPIHLSAESKQAQGENQPHSKLLVSIAKAMGASIDSFGYTGHGTGGLDGLFA